MPGDPPANQVPRPRLEAPKHQLAPGYVRQARAWGMIRGHACFDGSLLRCNFRARWRPVPRSGIVLGE